MTLQAGAHPAQIKDAVTSKFQMYDLSLLC